MILRRLAGVVIASYALSIGHQGPVHHQADLAQHEQPGHQQQHLLVRPAVGPERVPLLDHVVQDDLLVRRRHQVDVAAQVLDGLRVVLAGLEERASAWRCRCSAGRLDLLERVGWFRCFR